MRPEFFARLTDGTGVVINDVRADDQIKPKDVEAFEITARACVLAGWEFRRVGVIDPVQTPNMRWLSRYRPRRTGRWVPHQAHHSMATSLLCAGASCPVSRTGPVSLTLARCCLSLSMPGPRGYRRAVVVAESGQILGDFPDVTGGVGEARGSHSPRPVLRPVEQHDAVPCEFGAHGVHLGHVQD